MYSRILKFVGTLFICITALPIFAATETLSNVTVNVVLADGNSYGGCMANIDKVPQSTNCPPGWVTFSCYGVYNTPQAGKMKYTNAVLAFTLNKKLTIHIDDTKKHNNYCYAYRVDLTN